MLSFGMSRTGNGNITGIPPSTYVGMTAIAAHLINRQLNNSFIFSVTCIRFCPISYFIFIELGLTQREQKTYPMILHKSLR